MAPSLQWLVNIGQQMDCECIGGIEQRRPDSQDYSMQVDSDSVEGICGLSVYLDWKGFRGRDGYLLWTNYGLWYELHAPSPSVLGLQ